MTLIWLHGLKQGAGDFRKVFLDKSLVKLPAGCKIVLPMAPSRRVTVNGGTLHNTWFDVRQCGIPPSTEFNNQFLDLAYN